MRRVAVAVAALLAMFGSVACSGGKKAATSTAARHELIGLFRLTPGAVDGNKVTGTWFRMLQPGGNASSGPYMINADSPADGGQATLLQPGTSGGLRTGGYQSQPTPGFDSGGNSLSGAITTPTRFFGVKFSISTNETDLQTKTKVPPPTVLDNNGKLTADLAS